MYARISRDHGPAIAPAVRADLAPSGTLRAGVNYGKLHPRHEGETGPATRDRGRAPGGGVRDRTVRRHGDAGPAGVAISSVRRGLQGELGSGRPADRDLSGAAGTLAGPSTSLRAWSGCPARALDGRFMARARRRSGGRGPRRRARVPPRRRRGCEGLRPGGRAIERLRPARGARAAGPDSRPSARAMIPDFLYGTAWKEDRTAALTELALRTGFRGIDTANQRRHYFEAGGRGGARRGLPRGGRCRAADLFLQTKFTYQPGQDHRLPYDPRRRPVDAGRPVARELARAPRDRPRRQLRAPRPRVRPRLDGRTTPRCGRRWRGSATPGARGSSA